MTAAPEVLAATPWLMVADSFRVRDFQSVPQVRGLSLHVARFTSAVVAACEDTRASLPEHRLEEFLSDSMSQIAAYGAGNPRLELWGGPELVPELQLSLRPLPALHETIELRSATRVDTYAPERKGANIGLFAQLSRSLGAEALLIAADGTVIEGTTTSIVWWQGTSGYVVESNARVHSVTEQLINQIAIDRGERLTPSRTTAEHLRAHEVWAVNALHGIRRVTRINGEPQVAGDSHRLHAYRDALDRVWERVPAPH